MIRNAVAEFRAIDNLSARGPLIVRLLSIASWPEVSAMLPDRLLRSITSPGLASAIAWRRLPGPLSLVFVTARTARFGRGIRMSGAVGSSWHAPNETSASATRARARRTTPDEREAIDDIGNTSIARRAGRGMSRIAG